MPTVQWSRRVRTWPTWFQSDWEEITTQAGFTFQSLRTWERKHIAFATSNHVITQKGTSQCRWCLWWQRRDKQYWVLDAINESLTSPSGTCPNSAFPVTLDCKLPYYLSHTGFSVKVYCYLKLGVSHLVYYSQCAQCPLTLCFLIYSLFI